MARLELLLCAAFLTACGPAGAGTRATASAPASAATTLQCFRVHSRYPMHDGDVITPPPLAGIDDGTLYCLGPDRYFVKALDWNATAVNWKRGRSIRVVDGELHASGFVQGEAVTQLDFVAIEDEAPPAPPSPQAADRSPLGNICAKDPCACPHLDLFEDFKPVCPLRFSEDRDWLVEGKWSVRLVPLTGEAASRARREIERLPSPEHVCSAVRAEMPEQLREKVPPLHDLASCRAALKVIEQFRRTGVIGATLSGCSGGEDLCTSRPSGG